MWISYAIYKWLKQNLLIRQLLKIERCSNRLCIMCNQKLHCMCLNYFCYQLQKRTKRYLQWSVSTFPVVIKQKRTKRIYKQISAGTFFFFLSGFSFMDTDNSQDSSGREEIFIYSTVPLPPAHEHSDICMQLCM